MPTSERLVILKIAAEGGGITLLGRRTADDGWEYRRTSIDHSMQFVDEDEPPRRGETPWVACWDDAVELLDKYPWAMLPPLAVHPDFADRVLVAVTRRLLTQHSRHATRAMERWVDKCAVPRAPN